jgi:hypothetical protein
MVQVDNYILNRNKLIAEFMGWRPSVIEGGIKLYYFPNSETGEYTDTCKQESLYAMEYHKSWNWLMPVVEKVETTEYPLPEKYRRGFLKDETAYHIEIDTLYDPREEFKGWTGSVLFVHGNPIFDPGIRFKTKIEAMYNAVVGFIAWYNEQNK